MSEAPRQWDPSKDVEKMVICDVCPFREWIDAEGLRPEYALFRANAHGQVLLPCEHEVTVRLRTGEEKRALLSGQEIDHLGSSIYGEDQKVGWNKFVKTCRCGARVVKEHSAPRNVLTKMFGKPGPSVE